MLGSACTTRPGCTSVVTQLPLLRESGARLMFDHCGRSAPAASMGQAGRACVKLSGQAKISQQACPHPDMAPCVQALVRASDGPFLRPSARIDHGPLLRLFEQQVPDAAARQAMLWDTPRSLFGF